MLARAGRLVRWPSALPGADASSLPPPVPIMLAVRLAVREQPSRQRGSTGYRPTCSNRSSPLRHRPPDLSGHGAPGVLPAAGRGGAGADGAHDLRRAGDRVELRRAAQPRKASVLTRRPTPSWRSGRRRGRTGPHAANGGPGWPRGAVEHGSLTGRRHVKVASWVPLLKHSRRRLRDHRRRLWSSARMADLAARAGVSRQTLYNEFGNRDQPAAALALREAERSGADGHAAPPRPAKSARRPRPG